LVSVEIAGASTPHVGLRASEPPVLKVSRLAIMVSPERRTQAAQAGDTRNAFEDAVEHHRSAEGIAEAILDELHLQGNSGATRPAEADRDEAAMPEATEEE
jgi:hypothetical protein